MAKYSRSAIAALVVLLLLLTAVVGGATALMVLRTGVQASAQISVGNWNTGTTSQGYTPGMSGYGFSYWHGNSPRSGYCNGAWPGTVSTTVTVYPGSVLVHNPPPPIPDPSGLNVSSTWHRMSGGGLTQLGTFSNVGYATSYEYQGRIIDTYAQDSGWVGGTATGTGNYPGAGFCGTLSTQPTFAQFRVRAGNGSGWSSWVTVDSTIGAPTGTC